MKTKIIIFLCLPLLLVSTLIAKPTVGKRPTRLYFSSALFNARELNFNTQFVRRLEKMGYRVTLPQRDGFDYKNLKTQLTHYVSKRNLSPTSSDLIYLLNMGLLIPESDALIANLDNPIDLGVVVEMTYAHLMGKKVIGIRTGDKDPFTQQNHMGGIHGFVGYQCDKIILMHPHEFNTRNPQQALKKLAMKIRHFVPNRQANKAPHVNAANPSINHLIALAKKVIGNPKDIHTTTGLKRVAKNMVRNKTKIDVALQSIPTII